MAKRDVKKAKRLTIDAAREPVTKTTPTIIQCGSNAGYSMSTTLQQGLLKIQRGKQRVRFSTANSMKKFVSDDIATMVTYDLGVDRR